MRPYFVLCTLLLLLFSPLSALAQGGRTTTVAGTVIDAQDKSPLIGAVVSIDNAKHAITDVNGQFSIAGVAISRDSTKVEVSYLGYKTLQQTISATAPRTVLGTIELNPEGKMMDAVTVKAPPVIAVQKGDTVQYNAEAFKTNPDADASDLVSKMPGMQVTSSGVQAQGETVTRAYVDGKLLFGNDVMTALSNLPADAVESIQVFDELSDEARFSGFDDGNRRRALNIVTKGGKIKRTTMARVNGDYGRLLEKSMLDTGNDDLFSFRGMFNSFSEKNRISVMASSSNVNTWNAGQGGRPGGGNNSGGLGGGEIFTSRSVGIGGFNKWSDKFELTAGYRYNDRQTVTRTVTFQDNSLQARTTHDTTFTKTNTLTHSADLRLEWRPNKTNQIFFSPTFSLSDPTSMSMKRTTTTLDGAILSVNNPDNHTTRENISTSGDLVYMHAFAKKPGRSFSTTIQYNYTNNHTNDILIDSTLTSTNLRDQNTISTVYNKTASMRVRYSEPIASGHRISLTYYLEYENSQSDRRAYNIQKYGADNNLDTILSNTFTRRFYAQTTGLFYSFNKTKNRLNMGVNYRNAHLLKDQFFPMSDKQNRSLEMVLPRLDYQYEIQKNRNLRVSYHTSSPVPAVEQFQNVINATNPVRLTTGNPNLKLSYTHRLEVNYQSSNISKSTTYFMRFNIQKTLNQINNKTIFFNEDTYLKDFIDPDFNFTGSENYLAIKGSQLTIPVNLDGYLSSNLNTGYSFPVKSIRTNVNLSMGYGFTHNPFYQSNKVTGPVLNMSNGHNGTFEVKFTSNISSSVDFNIGYSTRLDFTTYKVGANALFWREQVNAQLNLIFLGGFVMTHDIAYQFNSSNSGNFKQDFYVWNAGLGRKFLKKKQAEFRITGYDILKQRKSLTHTENNGTVQDQWSYIRGRYVMATLTYRFNSLSNLSRGNSGTPQRYEGGGPPPEGMRFRDGGGPPGGGGGYQPGGGGGNSPF